MKSKEPNLFTWLLGIFGSIIVAWLLWVSTAINELKVDVGLIKYKVFNVVSEKDKTLQKETLEAFINEH